MKRKMKYKNLGLKWIRKDQVKTPQFFKDFYKIPNSTDKYLPTQRLDRKGREVMRDPQRKDSILVWVGSSHEMLEGLHTKFGGVSRPIPTDENDYVKDFFDLKPHKLFLFSIKESLITDYVARRVKRYGKAIYLMDIPHYEQDSSRIFVSSRGLASGIADVDMTSSSFDQREVDS